MCLERCEICKHHVGVKPTPKPERVPQMFWEIPTVNIYSVGCRYNCVYESQMVLIADNKIINRNRNNKIWNFTILKAALFTN